MKNLVTEMKNSLNGLSILDTVKEKISDHNVTIASMQNETQRKDWGRGTQ